MMSCHDFDKGYLYYECPSCDNYYMMGFSCHSRFCQSCGQKYKKERTRKISEKCLPIPHRQFVFTIPEKLRDYFRKYREFIDVLFKTVNETFNLCLEKNSKEKYRTEKRKLGFFLHTFGRDLKWHPHLHILIAERYMNKDGKLHKFDYFHFEFIRKTFQNKLFHNLYVCAKEVINDKNLCTEIFKLCQKLKQDYPNGYYVYGPKFNETNTTTKDIKELTNYITRYASHPAISERRILKIDELTNQITWFYDPHEDDDVKDEEQKLGRQIITEDVEEFIKKLIIHIPSKGFQTVRHYGFYSNKYANTKSQIKLFSDAELKKMKDNWYWIKGLENSFGYNPLKCKCGDDMILNFNLSFYPKVRGSTNET